MQGISAKSNIDIVIIWYELYNSVSLQESFSSCNCRWSGFILGFYFPSVATGYCFWTFKDQVLNVILECGYDSPYYKFSSAISWHQFKLGSDACFWATTSCCCSRCGSTSAPAIARGCPWGQSLAEREESYSKIPLTMKNWALSDLLDIP